MDVKRWQKAPVGDIIFPWQCPPGRSGHVLSTRFILTATVALHSINNKGQTVGREWRHCDKGVESLNKKPTVVTKTKKRRLVICFREQKQIVDEL